jgi:hypothetical protein
MTSRSEGRMGGPERASLTAAIDDAIRLAVEAWIEHAAVAHPTADGRESPFMLAVYHADRAWRFNRMRDAERAA